MVDLWLQHASRPAIGPARRSTPPAGHMGPSELGGRALRLQRQSQSAGHAGIAPGAVGPGCTQVCVHHQAGRAAWQRLPSLQPAVRIDDRGACTMQQPWGLAWGMASRPRPPPPAAAAAASDPVLLVPGCPQGWERACGRSHHGCPAGLRPAAGQGVQGGPRAGVAAGVGCSWGGCLGRCSGLPAEAGVRCARGSSAGHAALCVEAFCCTWLLRSRAGLPACTVRRGPECVSSDLR